MVSGSGFVKLYRFALRSRPKILLTAVFFSPIIRAERPRAASAGETLGTPGKASTPAVCGPSLGPQLLSIVFAVPQMAVLQSAGHRWVHSYRGLKWFESSPLTCGPTCIQTL